MLSFALVRFGECVFSCMQAPVNLFIMHFVNNIENDSSKQLAFRDNVL